MMPDSQIAKKMRAYLSGLTRQQKRHDWSEVAELMREAIREIELGKLTRDFDSIELARLRKAIEDAPECPVDGVTNYLPTIRRFNKRLGEWKSKSLKGESTNGKI